MEGKRKIYETELEGKRKTKTKGTSLRLKSKKRILFFLIIPFLTILVSIFYLNKFNKKYVCLVGTFNAERKGHMGLWSGSIENISKIWKPIKRKRLINL